MFEKLPLISPPLASILVVLALGALAGIAPMKKLIEVQEAKHELRRGSAGFLRTISGWVVIAVWLAAVWFCGTVIGDWMRLDDLGAAIDRAQLRLYILLEILAALSDS